MDTQIPANPSAEKSGVTLTKIFILIIDTGYLLIWCIYTFIMTILGWIKYITWDIFKVFRSTSLNWFPILVWAFIVYILVAFFWDSVMVPILSPLKDVLNILIIVWNAVATVAKIIGLNIPKFGQIGASFPAFWDVFSGLVYTAVVIPLEAGLKGTIIR